MPKAKPPPARKTRPSIETRGKETVPPVSHDRRKRAEAETLPPPPLPPTVPPPAPTVRPRVSGRVKKGPSSAANVDEVTADLSKDPRRES